MLELLLSIAIVTQDQIPLRAAPNERAARHATLSMGDNLEVRGVKGDYLQVYDHRRERAGYVRITQTGQYELTPEEAPGLKVVADFLTHQPGFEAMGIGHAAAFLKAAPAEAIDAHVFEDIGKMADRLAWRASKLSGGSSAASAQAAKTVAEHLEVVKQYGVEVYSVEHNEKMTLCYDGEAWRRVMALPATSAQKAHAALSLTRHECVKSTLSPSERLETDVWRAEVLDRALEASARDKDAPAQLKNRLKIRAAGVWASIAHQLRRKSGADAAVVQAGQSAETFLAAVSRNELVDGDVQAWNEAAIRVGASRWAAQVQALPLPAQGRPGIRLVGGEPGQTCVQVIEGEARHDKAAAFERCTYGQVWTSSLSVSPDGKMMTLAVQPLSDWREMWVFRLGSNGWEIDAIPPALDQPELGYVEFAGWVPGNKQFLVARETVSDNEAKTSFELWDRQTLKVEKHADKPGNLTAFYRWQDPAWKGGTVAVR
ncbi:hypothetical protein AGMMS49960_13790 [Betaproteobacteria bacterium]|nr:hypothetical protein AGMMS49543_21710 [Betaproteobacteria bacterium]GHU02144.1 hypothetical protein AGMMS49960_13790 [Betaproteobacteria bacterium]GHU20780.1 hypothetical protein AGMMS50243_16580 [Betaproteobacteria bacterium]